MKEVSNLVESGRVELVQMQDLSVGGLLNVNAFTCVVVVATFDIV